MVGSEQVEAQGALGVLGAEEAQEAAQVAEEAFRQPTLRPLRIQESRFLVLRHGRRRGRRRPAISSQGVSSSLPTR